MDPFVLWGLAWQPRFEWLTDHGRRNGDIEKRQRNGQDHDANKAKEVCGVGDAAFQSQFREL
jgi:hypothetical protein